jgi:hypothetical protein
MSRERPLKLDQEDDIMNEQPYPNLPSTTMSAAQVAQTQMPLNQIPSDSQPSQEEEKQLGFKIDSSALRSLASPPYERKKGQPLYRPLKIFTLDPAASKLEGSIAIVNVPYENLQPGPVGSVFDVDGNKQVNLDDPYILINNGLDPSSINPCFRQQMVYAICSLLYATFRAALGRTLIWRSSDKLKIYPFFIEERNAWYDPANQALFFGYYLAEQNVIGRNLPGGLVLTSLSHDIIVHECTHALLDGLRAQFTIPSNPDVLAFHEAFADLMAIFQHFSYSQVVLAAIRESKGMIEEAELLTNLATQFGQTSGLKGAMRTAIGSQCYGTTQESHLLGSILVSAIFEAFKKIFQRKTERILRLAKANTSNQMLKEISNDLQHILADTASKLASQFQAICIRAIDYCPPIDIEFGEYLRALITADYDLTPDDPWGYREALIDAFSQRKIYPRGVQYFEEESLLWNAPQKTIPDLDELSFAKLQFQGDPGNTLEAEELKRQANALGKLITNPLYIDAFGLAKEGDPRLEGDRVDLPCIHSIRTNRRVGPHGQIVFDLVCEVTQERYVRNESSEEIFPFHGGTTIILGPEGDIRYSISKSILNKERLERQRAFIKASPFWEYANEKYQCHSQLFKVLHETR